MAIDVTKQGSPDLRKIARIIREWHEAEVWVPCPHCGGRHMQNRYGGKKQCIHCGEHFILQIETDGTGVTWPLDHGQVGFLGTHLDILKQR